MPARRERGGSGGCCCSTAGRLGRRSSVRRGRAVSERPLVRVNIAVTRLARCRRGYASCDRAPGM